jgi:hypothetical protein
MRRLAGTRIKQKTRPLGKKFRLSSAWPSHYKGILE